jgi:putative FmdB family regulatory protein
VSGQAFFLRIFLAVLVKGWGTAGSSAFLGMTALSRNQCLKRLESSEGDYSRRNIALPLYEYRCTACGYNFEKIQNFSAKPETECPKCQGALIRPVTAPALRFEGAGWYVNDYAGKGGAKAGETAGAANSDAAASTESKADQKSESKAAGGETKATPAAAPAAAVAASPAPSAS